MHPHIFLVRNSVYTFNDTVLLADVFYEVRKTSGFPVHTNKLADRISF
jgi:hypothetical protein